MLGGEGIWFGFVVDQGIWDWVWLVLIGSLTFLIHVFYYNAFQRKTQPFFANFFEKVLNWMSPKEK